MLIARSQAREKAPQVALLVDAASVYGRAILRGVMKVASTERRWLIYKDYWRTTESLSRLPECDGAIVAGVTSESIPHIQTRARHVIVCSGGGDTNLTPVVSLNDVAAGVMGAEHLMNCRLEHFAFYPGGFGWATADNRRKGFTERLKAAGFECINSPITWSKNIEWITQTHRPALKKWLAELSKPCGILCVEDHIADDLADTCREAGIAVPDQIAILGVDNDDLTCELAWPPLSSIDAGFSRVGYQAARMLDRLLNGEKLKPEERVIRLPPLGVVQRISTNMMAVSDQNLADAVRFIREHACDPCTVKEVLRHVPVSRRYLERQFAEQFGRTPHEEITRVRIEQAKRLLVSSQLTQHEITERCGFSGVQNLARTFRKVTGLTPAAFRREMKRDSAAQVRI